MENWPKNWKIRQRKKRNINAIVILIVYYEYYLKSIAKSYEKNLIYHWRTECPPINYKLTH